MPLQAGPPGHARIVGSRPLSTRPAAAVAGPPAPKVTPDLDWMVRAACRWADPELFFAPDGERQAERTNREAQAKEFCAECPVKGRCELFAAEYPDLTKHGVWAGVSEDDREAAKRRKRRVQERAAAARKAKASQTAEQTQVALETRREAAGAPEALPGAVSAASRGTAAPGHHPELVPA